MTRCRPWAPPAEPRVGLGARADETRAAQPPRSAAAHKALHRLPAFQAPPWAWPLPGSRMPPSVVGGTVRPPLAALPPPSPLSLLLLPAPRHRPRRGLSPACARPCAPRERTAGPACEAALRAAAPPALGAHALPRSGARGSGEPRPRGRRPLPARRGAAGAGAPSARRDSRTPCCGGGGRGRAGTLAGRPAHSSLGLPVGLDKGHFLGGAGRCSQHASICSSRRLPAATAAAAGPGPRGRCRSAPCAPCAPARCGARSGRRPPSCRGAGGLCGGWRGEALL